MSTGPGPTTPSWRSPPVNAAPAATGPVWQTPPARLPYRPRWRKLGLTAAAGLAALVAVTWVVFWVRPPEPARLVVLQAGYDANLSVPPNPYGKAAARELAGLAKPGGWFGNRSRLNGNPDPGRLTRPGPAGLLADLDSVRERCVVLVLAAHGGRDRDGAFLFPDDATPDPASRIRMKAVIDRLAKLPAKTQKLLILDATECPAFPDLGLVHNDFAAALEELHDGIAAVPNLVVFASSGPDQRSWVCPEWGATTFLHFLQEGLTGAADADGDRRVNGWELVEYVRPRVHDFARDHRAALQTPVVLPRGEEGENRARAMHLAMSDRKAPAATAPVPFEPPAEIEQAWTEYSQVARAVPPPQAYTPHLWRQYEAWVLRFEAHLMAGDADGARVARSNASRLRQQIEDARRLAVRPQTLALPAAVGAAPYPTKLPDPFAAIAHVANPRREITPAERLKTWDGVRNVPGFEPETARLLWGRALLELVSEDPADRLHVVPVVLPLIESGLAVRPAELHFLAMLAAHVPDPQKSTAIGPLLKKVLPLRVTAERAAACVPDVLSGYPYAESCLPWVRDEVRRGDEARRRAEDLCFATDEASWSRAATLADEAAGHYARAQERAAAVRALVTAWHQGTDRTPGLGEWLARTPDLRDEKDRLAREAAFRADIAVWADIHRAGAILGVRSKSDAPADLAAFVGLGRDLDSRVRKLDDRLWQQDGDLLATRPEFEARPTPRSDAVAWWNAADAVLTAPPSRVIPSRRVDLLRESRRVSRQLFVTAQTRPEPLAEVTPEVTRERAFDAARRRGLFLLARIGPDTFDTLAATRPGEKTAQVEFRLNEFGFLATGRQSLAEAGTRLGEILHAIPDAAAAASPADADRLVRIAPASALVTGEPALQLRRTGVRDLLLNQARRTLDDHWYDGRGGRYYYRAIEQLRADAAALFPPPKNAPDEFAALLTTEEPFPVRPTVPDRVTVTDEPDPTVNISFTRAADRSGFAVFWTDPPFPPAKPAPVTRVAVDTTGDAAPLVRPITRPAGPPPTTPVPQSGSLRVSGFFRGRLLTQPTAVDVYAVPHQTAVNTPPADPFAKIAVRADPALAAKYGYGSGTVAVVLDCSGSMRPDPAVPGNRGLYPVAVEALRDLLTALPPGTVVSVRTFGRRTPGAKTAEDTIRVLVPPTTLPFDRAPTVGRIVAQAAAVPATDLYEKSPVTRAVLDAKDSLKAEPGPLKAVVLISDAVDTRFADDPQFAKPKRAVKDVLRAEFAAAGVPLCVVALPVVNPADVAAQAEFKVVEELRPAGRFVPPSRAKELGEWLRTGLNPRVRYTVEPVETAGPVKPFDLTAAADPPDEWYPGKLPPGRYRVKVAAAPGFAREVSLGPGDRLLLELTEDRGSLSLARYWSAARGPAVVRSGGEAADRKLALVQNRFEAGRVRMVAAVEGRPGTPGPISVDRVGAAWFEVSPVVPRPEPVAVRWRAEPGFPAPTWSVDVTGWPVVPGGKGAAAPVVEAWWNPGGPFPPTGQTWTPSASRPLVGTRNETIPVGVTAVTLDSVTVETHRVEVRPGVFDTRPCLVARLTHPKDQPAWVRPVGTAPDGSEVRFYRDANRVTCLFWWDVPTLTAETANARVTGFEVVSVAAVKAGPHLELRTVPAPTENSPPPVPPG